MSKEINVLDVLHDINIAIIFSKIIDEVACGDFADVMRKVTDRYDLTDKYKEYVYARYGVIPPT